jgi:hypothetical protein
MLKFCADSDASENYLVNYFFISHQNDLTGKLRLYRWLNNILNYSLNCFLRLKKLDVSAYFVIKINQIKETSKVFTLKSLTK